MGKFKRLGIVMVAGGLWIGAEAHAQILIDTFSVPANRVEASAGSPQSVFTPVTIEGSPASRRLSVAADGSAVGESNINGLGNWGANVSGVGYTEFTLEYSLLNLNLGTNYLLELTVDKVIATSMPRLDVSLTNTSAGITLSGQTTLTNTVTSYFVPFDVRTLTGYSSAFLTGVSKIELAVSGTGIISFGATSLQFVPVPEPSALWLLASALGLLLLRRRMRTVK